MICSTIDHHTIDICRAHYDAPQSELDALIPDAPAPVQVLDSRGTSCAYCDARDRAEAVRRGWSAGEIQDAESAGQIRRLARSNPRPRPTEWEIRCALGQS